MGAGRVLPGRAAGAPGPRHRAAGAGHERGVLVDRGLVLGREAILTEVFASASRSATLRHAAAALAESIYRVMVADAKGGDGASFHQRLPAPEARPQGVHQRAHEPSPPAPGTSGGTARW